MFWLFLARYRVGRALLHLICLARSGSRDWHWQGVCRAFDALRSFLSLRRRLVKALRFPGVRVHCSKLTRRHSEMKTCTCLILLFLGPCAAFGQIQFTSADLPSQVGLFSRAYATTSESSVSGKLGTKGGPQRWDFSQPKASGDDVYRIDIVTPDDGGKGSSFPAAGNAERKTRESSGKQSWEYYRILQGQGRAYFGFYDATANAAKPATVFEASTIDLPENIQFAQSWDRTVDWIDVIDVGFIQLQTAIHFTSHAEVDAYGTVALPLIGEVPALRVNEVNTYETTDLTLGLPLGTQNFRNYYWLVKGVGKAVHIISKNETSIPPENFSSASAVIRVFESTGIKLPPKLSSVAGLSASLRGKEMFLSWQRGATATDYRIETTQDITSNNWQLLLETKDNFWFDPEPPVGPVRFYRVWQKQ